MRPSSRVACWGGSKQSSAAFPRAAERTKFLAEMPLPARLAWRLLGRRAFGKEYREIYGQNPIW
ncbi:hypothetical protein [Nocardia farcinica]|uniref:hypothetical protein n=1 Tax=Nocardia farcinica TaxID=37329 RepID=UPI0024554646|nr:hypothetical protein [Nocardia farcinica]